MIFAYLGACACVVGLIILIRTEVQNEKTKEKPH